MKIDRASDPALIERFVGCRDEDAFFELVRRHGPLVLRTSRRILACEHDVEEVFQATFLLLARRAGGMAWSGSIGGWLVQVTRRLSLNARARVVRRYRRERPASALAGTGDGRIAGALPERLHPLALPSHEIDRNDLRRRLDEALGQLPEIYRAPVVLCYLEGKTSEEAARQLGWPAGSMSRRLLKARQMLRVRLGRSGLAIGLALVVAAVLAFRSERTAAVERTSRAAVRQTMQELTTGDREPMDLEALLLRVVQRRQTPRAEQAADLARKTCWTSAQLLNHDLGSRHASWLFYSARMGLAADDLARAAAAGDRLAMADAARSLHATCIRCHAEFRN